MPEKIPATALILTFNSATTLKRALLSVDEFAEILVCDGGSADGTRAIAAEAGARVISQNQACLNPDGTIRDFSCVRNNAVKEAKHDWVLWLDSDERASSGLIEDIRNAVMRSPDEAGFLIPSGIIVDGEEILHSSNYPGYQLRFFNRRRGEFRRPIHEKFIPGGAMKVGRFRHPWNYFLETKTAKEDFEADIRRDMPLYKRRYDTSGSGFLWKELFRAFRNMLAIAVKSSFNYLGHGFSRSYPPSLEWLRVRYQWNIAKTVLWSILSK